MIYFFKQLFRKWLPPLLLLTSIVIFSRPVFAEEKEVAKNQRIISLAPHITEMIYSAGAGHKLVGVVQYSNYPAEALKLPIIGSYNGINIEAIIALKPDVVIGWKEGNQLSDLKRLESLGIQVWPTEVTSLDAIPKQIQIFGKKFGTKNTANEVAKKLENELKRIRNNYQNRSQIHTFYQVWDKPFITINDQQFIGQAIKLCGGKNVFHDLTMLSAEVNIETVISKDPQLILLGGRSSVQQSWHDNWQKWPMVSAVKNKQIIKLNADHYQRPTARLIMALENLCHKIDQAR